MRRYADRSAAAPSSVTRAGSPTAPKTNPNLPCPEIGPRPRFSRAAQRFLRNRWQNEDSLDRCNISLYKMLQNPTAS